MKQDVVTAVCVLLGIAIVGATIFAAMSDVIKADPEKYESITTAEELCNMSSDGKYRLENNINMSGVEWVTSDFKGKLDGQEHSIMNLTKPLFDTNSGKIFDLKVVSTISGNDVGLIAKNNTGTIENVEVEGKLSTTVSSGDNCYCGGIAAKSSGTIKNCISDVEIIGSVTSGGIVGQTTSTVSGCKNYGVVNINNEFIGGIAGYAKEASIDNCENNAAVSGRNLVGGIAGYCLDIEDCVNKGKITASGEGENGTELGGICGSGQDLDNCKNCGEVVSESDNTRVGGIAGCLTYPETMTNLSNEGTVKSSGSYVGGLIGYCYLDDNEKIEKCSNTGSVSTNGSSVGGLIGYVTDYYKNYGVEAIECTNDATISGYNYVGGIIGYGGNYSTFENCSNTKAITGSGCNVGGISGYAKSADSCKNTGSVTTSGAYKNGSNYYSYVGGICGEVDYINNCTNEGSIKSTYSGGRSVGGLVGAFDVKSNSTTTNLINKGEVYGNGNSVGGLFGEYLGGNIILDLTGCSNSGNVTGGYNYVGGLIGYASYKASTDSLTITSCSNTGEIKGKCWVGGVIGYGEKTTIHDMSNSAKVTGSCGVGGLAGMVNIMYNCNNSGTIKATRSFSDSSETTLGGLVGKVNTIYSCTNTGSVTSTDSSGKYVGGIAGNVIHSADAANLTNSGSVSSSGQYVGGLVGHSYINGTKVTFSNCTNNTVNVTGSSYVGGFVGYIEGKNTSDKVDIVSCTTSKSPEYGYTNCIVTIL